MKNSFIHSIALDRTNMRPWSARRLAWQGTALFAAIILDLYVGIQAAESSQSLCTISLSGIQTVPVHDGDLIEIWFSNGASAKWKRHTDQVGEASPRGDTRDTSILNSVFVNTTPGLKMLVNEPLSDGSGRKIRLALRSPHSLDEVVTLSATGPSDQATSILEEQKIRIISSLKPREKELLDPQHVHYSKHRVHNVLVTRNEPWLQMNVGDFLNITFVTNHFRGLPPRSGIQSYGIRFRWVSLDGLFDFWGENFQSVGPYGASGFSMISRRLRAIRAGSVVIEHPIFVREKNSREEFEDKLYQSLRLPVEILPLQP